jgi:hypothetical protein
MADGLTRGSPCSQAQLTKAESALGVTLPLVLRRTYEEGDGAFDDAGQWWVIWPLDRLTSENSEAWTTARLDTSLLAFGDDGTGNPFCVRIDGAPDEVLRWSWIDGEVEHVEGPFAEFTLRWLA